jgi:hypothetical protein
VSEIVHVVPLNDLKSHIESGVYCHCQPEVRKEEAGTLIIHNAYDGREFFEEDESEPEGH